jgi:uncharacterized membrane protein YjjP (DUF1212 family)
VINIKGYEELKFAGLAGELLLKNGAETSRIEDTISRILLQAGFTDAEVLVFPTGIIISGVINGTFQTRAKRIVSRDINMSVVSIVNDISRKFTDDCITLETGLEKIRAVESGLKDKSAFFQFLFAGAAASGVATVLLGGSWTDVAPAFLATAMVRFIISASAFSLAYVLQHYIAGLLAGLIGSLFVEAGFGQHLDKIVVGALLPLVPGVALTNAVRDFITGDLLSGTLRMVEAILVATALAGGVGFALAIFSGYLKQLLY